MRPIITLTTDFGISSPYVAQMKAEIVSRNREALIVDITHSIRPQDVLQGSLVLDDVARRFPAGTIHVAVVDPGIGTSRQLIYVEIGLHQYLAPDNGLLTLVAERSQPAKVIALRNQSYWNADVSDTFHGRDILAPVAAHLSLGVPPEELGPAVGQLVMLSMPQPHLAADGILGQVLLADSFGNLITNISRDQLASYGDREHLTVNCQGRKISGVSRTYGDRRPGELMALLDSQRRLEIAVVNGSAAQMLAAEPGTQVEVRPHAPPGFRPK